MSCDDHRTGEVGSAAKRQRRNEGLVEDTGREQHTAEYINDLCVHHNYN